MWSGAVTARVNLRLGVYRPLGRDLVPITLVLEELEVARRALEGREAARAAAPLLRASPPVDRRDRGGRADEPSQEEGAKPTAALASVHDLILRSRPQCWSARSVISPST